MDLPIQVPGVDRLRNDAAMMSYSALALGASARDIQPAGCCDWDNQGVCRDWSDACVGSYLRKG